MTKTELKTELEIFKNDYIKYFLSGSDSFNKLVILRFSEATMLGIIDETIDEISKKLPYDDDIYELKYKYYNAHYDMEKEEFLFVKNRVSFDIVRRFYDKYQGEFVEHHEDELFW